MTNQEAVYAKVSLYARRSKTLSLLGCEFVILSQVAAEVRSAALASMMGSDLRFQPGKDFQVDTDLLAVEAVLPRVPATRES